jgi:hypothetical protein
MATAVRKATAKKVVKSVPVEVTATVASKATAAERLEAVLTLIDRQAAKPDAEVKWGKAVALAGGGSVYINRSNADVRTSTGRAAALALTIPNSTIRGAQGQYLRIAFTK